MDKKDEQNQQHQNDPAINLIRQKIAQLHAKEPDAADELAESATNKTRSVHQQFMYDLGTSGKSLAEIQTSWHNYYTGLPDIEKHKVWQEFYEVHDRTYNKHTAHAEQRPEHQSIIASTTQHPTETKTVYEIKQQVTHTTNKKHRPSKKQHLKSLLFGLSIGTLTVFVLLFGFFNERFIAPFISPSRTVSSTPILIDSNTTTFVSPEPKLIIPKINVELPVNFTETTVEEKAFQRALESGVVHYPNTAQPSQIGNGAIFGHSSGNLLNSGRYKFAFSLLHKLEVGDTFMIQKDSKPYFYKIYKKHVVPPSEVSVLDTQDKLATFTLITCDPPGLSTNRMIIVGEQISPNPIKNTENTAKSIAKPDSLPSNSLSLWQRLRTWLSN